MPFVIKFYDENNNSSSHHMENSDIFETYEFQRYDKLNNLK